MTLWRKQPLSTIPPGEAIDLLVDQWETDLDKVAWCRKERPDLPIDISLVSIAEVIWFGRDPIQQLDDQPRGGYAKAQRAILREFRTMDYETWCNYARAYFDGGLLPGQTEEGQIRAIFMRGQWQHSGDRPRWAKNRRIRKV